jgi:pyrroline-5-carboxylate reductase
MKLGVIGCGKMGEALVGGIVRSGVAKAEDVLVYDTWAASMEHLVEKLGVRSAGGNAEVATASEVILLCVKPQGFVEMLGELGPVGDKLLVSIAAGIRLETMAASCVTTPTSPAPRLVRVMPNTPALVGRGAAAYALGTTATPADAATTEALLGAVGYVCQVQEEDLDAVTALSGSGPAYIFLMIEALVAAGVAQGLDPQIAHDLAVHTVAGAAALTIQTGEDPAVLRKNVTSPNGTTFAALQSFEQNHFTRIVAEAVAAAADRSRELGGGRA